jgi:hypothetical protein
MQSGSNHHQGQRMPTEMRAKSYELNALVPKIVSSEELGGVVTCAFSFGTDCD